jgi:hypothetical protein
MNSIIDQNVLMVAKAIANGSLSKYFLEVTDSKHKACGYVMIDEYKIMDPESINIQIHAVPLDVHKPIYEIAQKYLPDITPDQYVIVVETKDRKLVVCLSYKLAKSGSGNKPGKVIVI